MIGLFSLDDFAFDGNILIKCGDGMVLVSDFKNSLYSENIDECKG